MFYLLGGSVHLVKEVQPGSHVRLALGNHAGFTEHYFVKVLRVHHYGHLVY